MATETTLLPTKQQKQSAINAKDGFKQQKTGLYLLHRGFPRASNNSSKIALNKPCHLFIYRKNLSAMLGILSSAVISYAKWGNYSSLVHGN